jgi:hypothetical protein
MANRRKAENSGSEKRSPYGPLQSFRWLPSTFKIFNNLGNLLFAQRQPKSAQRQGFCHGFATVVRELSRLAHESPDCVWILVAHRIPDK